MTGSGSATVLSQTNRKRIRWHSRLTKIAIAMPRVSDGKISPRRLPVITRGEEAMIPPSSRKTRTDGMFEESADPT